MQIKLRMIGGKHAGQEIQVPGNQFLIGRGEGCDLRPASEMVSRRHCEFVVADEHALVRDLGSSNGTLVNGERTKGDRILVSGDRIRVGPLELEVSLIPTVHPTSATQAGDTVAMDAPVKVKSQGKPEDYILDWLTDVPPVAAKSDTVDFKLDDTHSEPRAPVVPPAKEPIIAKGKGNSPASSRTMRLPKPEPATPVEPPPEVTDARSAASAAIGEMFSAFEKNRKRG